ncbi:hypothetical protein HID58_022535, partial [Brassica napus]
DSVDVCFTVFHSGNFELESTVTSYKRGEVLQLVCSPQMLFANMSEALENSLFGQRVWYKLPSENFGELKMMCNGDVMFDLLVQSTILTKLLNEPKKKMIKLSMEGRSSHCGRCEISCYNSRSCPNEGCPVYRPKKQVSRPSQSEGPTQPSQN